MSPKSLQISSITPARDEEARIGKCLEALSFCDERIVVDNGSTDKTAKVAQKKGAKVVASQGLDFGRARNTGKEAASGEWLLYIDADELVTADLAREIETVVRNYKQGDPVAYAIKRNNIYLGHPWPYRDQHLRLFRVSALKGWRGQLHETPNIEGQTGELKHPLIHDTHRNLEEMVAKTNEWSEIEARLRFDAGHPPVVPWRILRVMSTAFWDSFIRQGGLRAGVIGLVESIYQAFSIFITYAKLWELQNKKNQGNS